MIDEARAIRISFEAVTYDDALTLADVSMKKKS